MTPRLLSSTAARHAICRLLVVTFLILLLSPLHYHLHHTDDPVGPGAGHATHAIDLHVHFDTDAIDHHADSHILPSEPKVSLKTSGGHLPWVAVLIAFVLLLPLLGQGCQPLPIPPSHRLPRCYRHTIPPLRAPPRR